MLTEVIKYIKYELCLMKVQAAADDLNWIIQRDADNYGNFEWLSMIIDGNPRKWVEICLISSENYY